MTHYLGFLIGFYHVTFQFKFDFFYFLIHADLQRTKTWMQPEIKSRSHLTEKKKEICSHLPTFRAVMVNFVFFLYSYLFSSYESYFLNINPKVNTLLAHKSHTQQSKKRLSVSAWTKFRHG